MTGRSENCGRQMFKQLSIAVPLEILAVMVAVLAYQMWRVGQSIAMHLPKAWSGEERRAAAKPNAIAPNSPAEDQLIAVPLDVHEAAVDHGRFLSRLSHELNGPLNAVMGFVEKLLASYLNPAQRRQAELIGENSRTMLRLLGDVLDVGRLESGELRIVREEVDIRHLLTQCASLLRPNAELRGLSLSVQVAEDMPLQLPLDSMRLRQVLLNLLGNAVKFTDSGKVELEARSMPLADGRPGIGISVIDTGKGIATDRLEAIFHPFSNGHDGDDLRPAGGTGLGLAISRRIITAMDGEMSVRSALGLGSCFTVHLPCQATLTEGSALPVATGRTGEVPALGPQNLADQEDGLRGQRVLVAEDHEINQALLLAMLEALGMVATLVTNGHDAIEAIDQAHRVGTPFAFVLMDLRMPGMDGLEATMQLRAAGHSAASLPIIALTANSRPEDIETCLAAGMQAHIAKPVRMPDLGRTLRMVARLSQQTAKADPLPGKDLQADETSNPAVVQRLERRYRQRKTTLFASLSTIVAESPAGAAEVDWFEIGTKLRKLADVAANFGDDALGDLARTLAHDLKSAPAPAAKVDVLLSHWPVIAQFA